MTELQSPSEALSTAPAPPGAEPERPGRSGRAALVAAARRGWRRLTSMGTALLLLSLLALAAIPGSLIPQTNVDPQSVTSYINHHHTLGPLAQRFGMFDVFASPWFAAIYLLLFISLIGCLVPRIRLHAAALRRRPPKAPRRLAALSTNAGWGSERSPADVVAAAAATLRGRRWRVEVTEEPGGAVSVAAEKGYLRETGNLIFHISLLLLLVGVALSGLFGYKGQVLITQGGGFADSPETFNTFSPPRVGTASLPPFSFHLNRFRATYTSDNEPASFDAFIDYKSSPAAAPRPYDVRVNHPLHVGGTNVYLINDGYAVDLTVRGAGGRVIREHTPFLSDTGTTNLEQSHGVVKIPDIGGRQLGLTGELYSDFDTLTGTSVSSAAKHPVLALAAFEGNLGLGTGVPQNDFVLDTRHMHQIGVATPPLQPGRTWKLENGDRVTFDGVTPYAVFQVAHDPGKWPALFAAGLILVGLTLSLRVRRRRFWVRAVTESAGAVPGGDGRAAPRSVVTAAGLTRSDPDGFAREFAELVAQCGGTDHRPSPTAPRSSTA